MLAERMTHQGSSGALCREIGLQHAHVPCCIMRQMQSAIELTQ